MAEFIKLKNANKRVQSVFRNGMRQTRGGDYTLTSKGVSLYPKQSKDSSEKVTLIVEEVYYL